MLFEVKFLKRDGILGCISIPIRYNEEDIREYKIEYNPANQEVKLSSIINDFSTEISEMKIMVKLAEKEQKTFTEYRGKIYVDCRVITISHRSIDKTVNIRVE